ncbi:MAG TPA: FtsX-like permease family protein [Alphaproteobacteria bacterium]|jgi:cell division transport system permease protein|nr:FtsX-like permease family protein [Alphaproteobacteria bacterium]
MSGIPFKSEQRSMRALSVLVTGLMVALGILVLAGAATLRHVDTAWRHALTDRWTVETTAADADKTVAALTTTQGITGVRVVPAEEMRHLLQPWLHDAGLTAELPLPTLIDVVIDRERPPSAAVLAQKLAAAVPGAKLDDHGSWTRDLLRIAEAGETIGLAVFAAIALTAALTIAATARTRLAVNRDEIELLHSLGATDGFIAGQFQAGAFRATVVGVVTGAVLAASVILGVIKGAPPVIPFVAELRLEPADWAVLALVPVGALLLALLVTRWTAYGLARRLP